MSGIALTSYTYPDLAIDHVRIWLIVPCFFREHGMNGSVPEQGSFLDPEIFQILMALKYLLDDWAQHPFDRPVRARPPL